MSILDKYIVLILTVFVGLIATPSALAHCDGLDGPVVQAARAALDKSDVNLALVWVQPGDEKEIREVFRRAVAVRKLGAEAQALADRHFFETLVRLHRAGEGAPYTGLQPAGRDLGPAIPAADKALETGRPDAVLSLLADSTRHTFSNYFERAMTLRNYDSADVEAGRNYVAAYVEFIHFVERLYQASRPTAEGHFRETPE